MKKKGYTGRSREHSLNRRGIKTAGGKNQAEELAKALDMKPQRVIPSDIKDWDDDLLHERYIDIMEEFLMLRRARVPHDDEAWKWVMARSTQLATEMDKRGLKPKPLEEIKREYAERLDIPKEEFDLPREKDVPFDISKNIFKKGEVIKYNGQTYEIIFSYEGHYRLRNTKTGKIHDVGEGYLLEKGVMRAKGVVDKTKYVVKLFDEKGNYVMEKEFEEGGRFERSEMEARRDAWAYGKNWKMFGEEGKDFEVMELRAEGVIFGADVRQRYDKWNNIRFPTERSR